MAACDIVNQSFSALRKSGVEKITDGKRLWKITTGKEGMPSFEKDLTEPERWHVINDMHGFSKHP
jgi:hypothetical protein